MKTILLVDDSEEVRKTYSMVLRKSGYQVIEADSGVAGLALGRKHLPDLIISDIDMPGGDGATLLREIRHDPELRSKQVVLMTGRPDLVTPRKGMEEGADDFLLKPFDQEALENCVEARFARAAISWRVEDQTLKNLRSGMPAQLPHEFFTPMAGIIGLMEILREGSSSFSSAEIDDIANDVYQSALRLNRTLRNYLLILELPAVESNFKPELLPPSRVLDSIQSGIKEALLLSNRQDDVTVEIEACSISAKPENLSRIVEELVDNACKFSRQGTPVSVRFDSDGKLKVTDKGRGMTSAEINRIGAFQQFDRHKHEQQGLGLGLVLVQRLAALSGGKLLITSQPGEGTAAEISFSSGNLTAPS
jgi:two-component system sensor histidine kinase/response regulator